MDPAQQLRNLRDFLLVYNRMTEICFQRCSSNFNYRNLTMDEERCVDNCAGKLIRSNHRLMGTYVQLMPQMVQRRMEEMESKAKEAEAAAAAAAAAASQGPSAAEAPAASQVPDSSFPSPDVPAPLSTVVSDMGPDGPGFSSPIDLDAAIPRSTAEADVTFSAGAPLTPASEALSPPLPFEAAPPPAFPDSHPAAPSALSEATVLPVISESVIPPVIPEFTLPPNIKEATAPPVISEAPVLPVLSESVKQPVLSEAINLPVLSETIGGSSHTDVIPHPPKAAVHTESVSPAPVLMPLNPTSLSEDVPVSSAPAVSVQQRAPEAPPPPSSQ